MKKPREVLIEVTRLLLSTLETASDNEIELLLTGGASLRIVKRDQSPEPSSPEMPSEKSKQSHKRSTQTGHDSENLEAVAERLRQANSTEAASQILDEACPTKAKLLRLARHLDVHVSKEDESARIKSKIVDTTLGFRLRSEAIRGDLNRSQKT